MGALFLEFDHSFCWSLFTGAPNDQDTHYEMFLVRGEVHASKLPGLQDMQGFYGLPLGVMLGMVSLEDGFCSVFGVLVT